MSKTTTTPNKNSSVPFVPQPHTQPPALLNYRTLWQFYGLAKGTMSKKVMNGTFCNIVKIGRRNYFRREDVEAWIDRNTVEV